MIESQSTPSRRNRRPARPSGLMTALEWEGAQLRVVQGEAKGEGCQLTRLEFLALPEAEDKTDPATLGKAISHALAQAKVKIPGPVLIGIPRGVVVLRTLTLPKLKDLRALASMVHFQIAKDLPFRLDEAVIDFKVGRDVAANSTEATETPQQEVLAAAVRQEIVDFYLRTAEAAGLKLAGLGLLSYGNARCLESCNVAHPNEALALVSVRSGEIGIEVIGNETLLFSRNALVKLYEEDEEPPHEPLVNPEASGDAANGKARSFEELATIEVVRTLHGFGGAPGSAPITRVVVAGVTGLENVITRELGERLPVPCEVLDIGAALSLPPESRAQAPGAIGPIGLVISAFDGGGNPFNFLDPKKPAVVRDLRKIRILAAAAAIVLLLIGVMAVRANLVKKRMVVLAGLQTQLDDLDKQRPIFRKMLQQSKVIDDWTKSGQDWLLHYGYLSAILPASEDVYLTSFAVSGNGVIRLNVQARSGEIFARLEKQLRAAHYDVKPIAITPATDRYGYDFRSTIELTPSRKFKADLAAVKPPARPGDDASLDPAVLKKGGKW